MQDQPSTCELTTAHDIVKIVSSSGANSRRGMLAAPSLQTSYMKAGAGAPQSACETPGS